MSERLFHGYREAAAPTGAGASLWDGGMGGGD